MEFGIGDHYSFLISFHNERLLREADKLLQSRSKDTKMDTRQIKLGPKLFAKEKAMYRDWLTALIRENIQNSVDAGATEIDIRIEDESNLKKVTFSDNGPGMDMDTLENVYFILGETTKLNPQSIGGFGIARMLTAFAQEKYTLRTRDIFVEGRGAEWTPQTGQPFYSGVEIAAWIDSDRDIESVFKDYLRTCYIKASVKINGNRFTEWAKRNKLERALSFGDVYTNQSKSSGVIVRSNGVTMFQPYCTAPFLVIVELDSSRSRSILQSHRDGLLYTYQNELESFISELNINKQSALRQKNSKSISYKGTGTFTSRRQKKSTKEQVLEQFQELMVKNKIDLPSQLYLALKEASEISNEALESGISYVRKELVKSGVLMSFEEYVMFQKNKSLHSGGYDNEEEIRQLEFDLFNVMVEDETSNPKVRRVIESFYPQSWDLKGEFGTRYDQRYGEFRPFKAGNDKYKLLLLWKSACEYAIRLLQDNLQIGREEISWGVGWVFSDTSQAVFKTDGEETNWLLLNPCDVNGKMRFSISDKRDLIKIISLACHECCHIVISDHDERFANLLNDLMEEAMANLSDILKNMKESKQATENSQIEIGV